MFVNSHNIPENQLIIPDKMKSVSATVVVMLLFTGSFTTSVMSGVSSFASGYVTSIIIQLVFCLIMYYSMWLLSQSLISSRLDTEGLVWNSFSPKTMFVLFLIVFVPCFGFIIQFFNQAHSIFSLFFDTFDTRVPAVVRDYFFISLMISAVFLLAHLLRQDLQYFKVIAALKIAVIICLLALQIYELSRVGVSKDILPFNSSLDNFVLSARQAMSSFCMQMFYFPYVGQLRSMTVSRLKNVNILATIVITAVQLLFSIIQYLAFGNEFYAPFYGLVDQNIFIARTLAALGFLLYAMTIPMLFLPAHRAALYLIKVDLPYPREIWGISGLALIFLAIFIGSLDKKPYEITKFISDVFISIIVAVFPTTMYSATAEKVHWYHVVGMTVINVVMAGCVVATTYYYFFTELD